MCQPVSLRMLLFASIILCVNNFLTAKTKYIPETSEPLTESWRWTHFNYLDGKGFVDFTEDNNQIMYFALQKEIVSYDGYNWQTIPYSSNIKGNPVSVVYANSSLYLRTSHGLFCYTNNVFTSLFTDPARGISSLIKLNDTLLLSSYKGGFAVVSKETVFIVNPKANFNRIDSLNPGIKKVHLPVLNGTKQVTLNGAVMKKNNKALLFLKKQSDKEKFHQQWTIELNITKLLNKKFPAKVVKQKGNLKYGLRTYATRLGQKVYLVSEDNYNGISTYKGTAWSYRNLGSRIGISNTCGAIRKISPKNVLVAGQGFLMINDTANFKVFSYPEIPISSSATHKIHVTKEGNLWVGGIDSKVFFVNYADKKYKTYKNLVYQCESGNGDIWFLSKDNTVVCQTDSGMYEFNHKDGLMRYPAKIISTASGDIWCAGSQLLDDKFMFRGAVAHYKNGKWITSVERAAYRGVNQNSFYEDKNGNLWIGALDKARYGSFKIAKNKKKTEFTNFNNINEIPTGFTEAIDCTLFAGNYKFVHQFSFEEKKWIQLKNLTNPTSLSSHSKTGTLWIGTRGYGLYAYNGNIIETFDYNNKLKSNVIYNVFADSDSTLWVATDQDITRFDGKTWINHSLPQPFVLSGQSGNIKTDSKNNVWINKVSYTWAFRVVHLKKTAKNIDDIYCYKYVPDTISPKSRIVHFSKTVDKNGNTFISWAGNDYYETTLHNELLFSYKLNNENWSDFENITSKTFIGLKSGKYTFYLRAKDKDGNMEALPSKVNFEVLPPIWKQAWFITLICFFIVTVLYLISRIVVRNKMLNASNVELKHQKEEIQMQAEELETQKDALAESHEAITQSFKRFEMLSEFGQKITATLNLDAIYEMIFNYASSVIDISTFGIGLYDKKANLIYYPKLISNNKVRENVIKHLNDTKSLTSRCFNEQRVFFINDMEQEAADYGLNPNEIAGIETSRSRIHIPLTVENKKLGILVVNSVNTNAYSKEDLTNLQTLASYISIALDNAKAYDTIHLINKNTEKSINYASTIQNAYLPQASIINKYIDSFVLFKPKDIVSGDYYWFYPIEANPDKPTDIIIAAMDCTGHGVPGALMSLVGNNLMREFIIKDKIYEPAQILTKLNHGVKETLKQETTGNNDGMDASIARVQQTGNNTFKILFGGAKNPLVIVRSNGELEIIKGSRYSIGGAKLRTKKVFEQQEITLKKGEKIYLFTDGFSDQNGPDREKFGRENMLKLLQENSKFALADQKLKLENVLTQHMQNEEQRDDITVIGITL